MSEDAPTANCTVCGSENVTNRNVESSDINLCSGCAVDYQSNWRPKRSPVEPDVGQYVAEVRAKIWTQRG